MVNSGDTGFVLICAAFVFFMTPGLALFYGGLGRRKNVVNTMLSSLFLVGVSIVLWVLVGYSLSFSGNIGGVIGNLDWIGMKGVGMEAGPYADSSLKLHSACCCTSNKCRCNDCKHHLEGCKS